MEARALPPQPAVLRKNMASCRPDGRMPVLSQSPGKRSLLILRVASMRRNWSVPCIGDGSVLPMPRRRTFASASCLRSLDADCAPASCLRWSATPALGTWAAPHGFRETLSEPTLGPEGRVSTSGRRPAKKKRQDVVFFVNTAPHDRSMTSTSSPVSYRRPPAGSASRPAAPASPSRSDEPDQGSGVAARPPSETASRQGR